MILDRQLVVLERLLQRTLEPQPLTQACVHLGRIELVIAATLVLRVIERNVGVLEELLRIRSVLGINAYPYARRNRHAHAVKVQRHLQHRANSIRDCIDHFSRRQQGRHDNKLVAAHTYDDIVRGHRSAQSSRDGREQLVATPMPKRVVDVLEVIEIHVQQGEPRAVAAGSCQQARQQPLQVQPVWKSRQRIAPGEAGDLALLIEPLALNGGTRPPRAIEHRQQQDHHQRKADEEASDDISNRPLAEQQGVAGHARR